MARTFDALSTIDWTNSSGSTEMDFSANEIRKNNLQRFKFMGVFFNEFNYFLGEIKPILIIFI